MARIRKFRELDERMRIAAEKITRGVEELVAETGKEIGKEVVIDTPVDTGHARANWRPSINAPAIVPVTRADKTGAGTIARISVVAKQFKAGDVFYLTNNVPYIEQLNEGSSPQAEPNFVQDAVKTAVERAVRAKVGGIVDDGD